MKTRWSLASGTLLIAGLYGVWVAVERVRRERPVVAPIELTAKASAARPVATSKIVASVANAATLPPETAAEREERVAKFGDIPREKLAQARKIIADYEALEEFERELPGGSGRSGFIIGVTRAQKLLWRERQADLQKLLTPDEADEFEMHIDSVGKDVLENLSTVTTSREERIAVYRQIREFFLSVELTADKGANAPLETPWERSAVKVMDSVNAMLGDDRFDGMLRKGEGGSYQALSELAVKRFGSPGAALQLWRLKYENEARVAELQAAAAVSTEKPSPEKVATIKNELRAKAVAVFGETAVAANPGAFSWLPGPK